jgi:ABC-2 type transport system permease protein
MKKILVILCRESRLRLRRPSFWVLTLLVPLLLAALYALPVVAASHADDSAEVLVVDETGLFANALTHSHTDAIIFRAMPDIAFARRTMEEDDGVTAILFIPRRETTIPNDAFLYLRNGTPPLKLQSLIAGQLQRLLHNAILEDVYHLEPAVFHSVENATIRLHTHDAATGRESFAHTKTVVALVLAILITLALIIFGVQVMRSVQEEKATRVAEVMASTVRPVQLLIGKIAGVALTALMQLMLWTLLTLAAVGIIQRAYPDLFAQAYEQQAARSLATKGAEATAQYNTTVTLVDETVQGLTAINLPLVAAVFALMFLLGYLLYGALLAAVAARLDSDADALQWVLVLMSPMLIALMLSPLLLQSPGSMLGHWLTLVPFTAPAAVMLRLPFGIASAELVGSLLLLAAAFAAAALLAARVYRRHLVR